MSLSRRFFQICTAAAADALKSHGLTPMESGVLAYLNRKTGQPDIDQNTLAERMGIDRSNASLLIERLAARGLLDRRVNMENRRAHILSLTPAGEKAYAATRPSFNAGQAKDPRRASPQGAGASLRLPGSHRRGQQNSGEAGRGPPEACVIGANHT